MSSHQINHGLKVAISKMKRVYLRSLMLFLCIFTIAHSTGAAEPNAAKPKQFIYVLRLVPRLHSDAAWTKEDEMVIARHLTRFRHAVDKGD